MATKSKPTIANLTDVRITLVAANGRPLQSWDKSKNLDVKTSIKDSPDLDFPHDDIPVSRVLLEANVIPPEKKNHFYIVTADQYRALKGDERGDLLMVHKVFKQEQIDSTDPKKGVELQVSCFAHSIPAEEGAEE